MVKTVNKKLLALSKPLPKYTKGQRVRVFGVTKPQHRNPSTWTINQSNASDSLGGKVMGHAHGVVLKKPEFRVTKSGMWNVRGYNLPKDGVLQKATRPPQKTPYSFIVGDLEKAEEFRRKKAKPRIKGVKYKSGRLDKVRSVENLLSGENDKFIGQKLRNNTTRELIGEKRFKELGGKGKLQKGKYHLVSEVKLRPNAEMYYYNENPRFLIDF